MQQCRVRGRGRGGAGCNSVGLEVFTSLHSSVQGVSMKHTMNCFLFLGSVRTAFHQNEMNIKIKPFDMLSLCQVLMFFSSSIQKQIINTTFLGCTKICNVAINDQPRARHQAGSVAQLLTPGPGAGRGGGGGGRVNDCLQASRCGWSLGTRVRQF